MKKRRDLDALVNGKLGGRRKKNGQHELLRNTDSSDIEEFAIPPQNLARKHRSTSRFCSTCLAVCGFFLLTACAVAVTGLVWVHIELKKDVDLLQIRLSTVENGNAGNTNEFQDVHTSIQQFSDEIQELKAKADSFQKNFTAVWNKLNQLSSQKQTQSTSPEIAEMKKNVALLGSDLESWKQSTRQELDQIQKTISISDQVTPQMEQRSSPDLVSVKTDIFGIQQNISLLNTTFFQSITNLRRERELVSNQINTSLVKLDDRLSILELKPITEATIDRSMIQDTVHEAVQDALMSAAEPDKNQQVSYLETLVNNITLEVDQLKVANKYFNTSIKSSQQQLDQKAEELEKRLDTLANSQAPSAAPSNGALPSPKPSSPDASTEKKSGNQASTQLTESPTQEKPTPPPIEEAKDGDTDRGKIPLPPGVGSDEPKPSDQDDNQNYKKNGIPEKAANNYEQSRNDVSDQNNGYYQNDATDENNAIGNYNSKDDTNGNYNSKDNANGNYNSKDDANGNYNSKDDANGNYNSKDDANGNYNYNKDQGPATQSYDHWNY